MYEKWLSLVTVRSFTKGYAHLCAQLDRESQAMREQKFEPKVQSTSRRGHGCPARPANVSANDLRAALWRVKATALAMLGFELRAQA